jgi:hypothetical protein
VNAPDLSSRRRTAGRRRVAAGSDGAGIVRRLYRLSPLRTLIKVHWDHRGLRPDDVILASYPRSGSAWLRFLLVELLSGEASFSKIRTEAPYVGSHRSAPELVPGGGRLVKSHEPYLPHYRRAMHLVRDPRDVALSYFRFMQRIGRIRIRPGDDLDASLDRFLRAFMAGRCDAHGTWQTHLLSWVAAAETGQAEVLRLRYEDMRSDPGSGLLRIAGWLGVELTADEAAAMVDRCSIERMRSTEATEIAANKDLFHPAARKTGVTLVNEGRVAGWRDRLDTAQQERFVTMAAGMKLMGYPLA